MKTNKKIGSYANEDSLIYFPVWTELEYINNKGTVTVQRELAFGLRLKDVEYCNETLIIVDGEERQAMEVKIVSREETICLLIGKKDFDKIWIKVVGVENFDAKSLLNGNI